MGFRDDTAALQSRVELLEREVSPLEERLAALEAEAVALAAALRKQRFRASLRCAGHSVAHNKALFGGLVLSCLVFAGSLHSTYQQRRYTKRAAVAVLGEGCPSTLEVLASRPGTRVRMNQADVGQTPVTLSICPGEYQVQLIHDRALPWTGPVTIAPGQHARLFRPQIPWNPAEQSPEEAVVFSSPENATVFVDGKECGRTPMLLPQVLGKTSGTATIAVYKPGYRPFVRELARTSAVWVHLGALLDERDHYEAR